jgi:hypothetical protein
MDPIHPIVTPPPALPPIAPTSNAGRVDREGARGQGWDRQRRRKPAGGPAPGTEGRQDYSYDVEDDDDGPDDGGLHINVTA